MICACRLANQVMLMAAPTVHRPKPWWQHHLWEIGNIHIRVTLWHWALFVALTTIARWCYLIRKDNNQARDRLSQQRSWRYR